MRFRLTIALATLTLISLPPLGAILHSGAAVYPAFLSGDNNTIANPNTSRNVEALESTVKGSESARGTCGHAGDESL